MLYNEVKADKNFQLIMNGALTEHLKSPLDIFQTDISSINEMALTKIDEIYRVLQK